MIKVRCSWCQRLLGVADDKAGAEVLCKCGQPVPVPADGADASIPLAALVEDDFSALVSASSSKPAEYDRDHHPEHLRALLPSPLPSAIALLGAPKRLYQATFLRRGPLSCIIGGGIMLALSAALMTTSMRDVVTGGGWCFGCFFVVGNLIGLTMLVLPFLAAGQRIIVFERGFIHLSLGKTKVFPWHQIRSIKARRVQVDQYEYYEYTITSKDHVRLVIGDSWDDVHNLVRRIRRGAKLLEE